MGTLGAVAPVAQEETPARVALVVVPAAGAVALELTPPMGREARLGVEAEAEADPSEAPDQVLPVAEEAVVAARGVMANAASSAPV